MNQDFDNYNHNFDHVNNDSLRSNLNENLEQE